MQAARDQDANVDPTIGLPSGRCDDVVMQGVSFAGPAVCMVACALLTPAGTAHAPGSSPTALIVALFSAAFAMGAWARAGLYCNHQVQRLLRHSHEVLDRLLLTAYFYRQEAMRGLCFPARV